MLLSQNHKVVAVNINEEKVKYQNFLERHVISELYKFRSAGMFKEKLPATQDYDMWL